MVWIGTLTPSEFPVFAVMCAKQLETENISNKRVDEVHVIRQNAFRYLKILTFGNCRQFDLGPEISTSVPRRTQGYKVEADACHRSRTMKEDYLGSARTDTIGSNPHEEFNTWKVGNGSFYQN